MVQAAEAAVPNSAEARLAWVEVEMDAARSARQPIRPGLDVLCAADNDSEECQQYNAQMEELGEILMKPPQMRSEGEGSRS